MVKSVVCISSYCVSKELIKLIGIEPYDRRHTAHGTYWFGLITCELMDDLEDLEFIASFRRLESIAIVEVLDRQWVT